MNSLESSLKELKAFTGLVNACSPPGCCTEFYAPDSMSSMLVERIAFGQDEEDDLMDIMDDNLDVNTITVTKSIRVISNNDIFTNIVQVCERYGFVRPHIATELLKKKTDIETEPNENVLSIDQVRIQSEKNKTHITHHKNRISMDGSRQYKQK